MKMSELFEFGLCLEVRGGHIYNRYDEFTDKQANAIEDAVDSHDKLIERVKELEECLSNFLIADEMIGSGMNVHGGLSMMTGNMDIAKQLLEKNK